MERLLELVRLKTVGMHCELTGALRVFVTFVLKMGQGSQCSDTVQLHTMQEVFAIFQIEEDAQSVDSAVQQTGEQLFLTLSTAAVCGLFAPRTFACWVLCKVT